MFGGPEVSYHQTNSARDWFSILRTAYPARNLQRKYRTDSQMKTKATRKENNWKTEEGLARAAVTLETERIKGSKPLCLWWWLLSYMCIGLHVKCPSFLSDCKEAWIFLTDFRLISIYQISWKSFQWESSCLTRTDGQTKRCDETNSHISQFYGKSP